MMEFTPNQRSAERLFTALILICSILWFLPVYMMVSVSLMPPDIRAPAFGGLIMPKFSLYNYTVVFGDVPMPRHFLNSLIITVPTVVLVGFISSLAAYAFSRMHFPGRDIFLSMLLITLMLPIPTLIIPLFQINKNLNLINSFIGLILPYTALGVPFAVVIFRGFFLGFPGELEDAARVDGCGSWVIYSRLVMPVSGPALSVVIIWQSMKTWNEFLLALVTIDKALLKPLPLIPFIYNGQYMSRPGAMFAVLTLMSLPIVVLYIVMQRFIISGLTSGAVKG